MSFAGSLAPRNRKGTGSHPNSAVHRPALSRRAADTRKVGFLEVHVPERILSDEQLKRQFIAGATPLHFGLTVSPTEQCNFRCTYCYEDFELKRMDAAVQEALRRLVARMMPGLRSFTLNWFGGEPLLEWQMVGEFTAYCRELARTFDVRMPGSNIPTNAWSLRPERLAYLVESGVDEFMVSLDGEAALHDRTRRLISGRGTFDRIYQNLLAIRDTAPSLSFRIILRLHLHQDNIDSQRSLARRLHRDFAEDRRFIVHPIALGDFGGPTIHQINLISEHQSTALQREIKALFGPERSFDDSSDDLLVCYAAKPNHILVRPNGRLAKCTSALGRADNDVGQLRSDGTLAIDAGKAALWSFGFETGRPDHLACPFHEKPREAPLRFVRNALGRSMR